MNRDTKDLLIGGGVVLAAIVGIAYATSPRPAAAAPPPAPPLPPPSPRPVVYDRAPTRPPPPSAPAPEAPGYVLEPGDVVLLTIDRPAVGLLANAGGGVLKARDVETGNALLNEDLRQAFWRLGHVVNASDVAYPTSSPDSVTKRVIVLPTPGRSLGLERKLPAFLAPGATVTGVRDRAGNVKVPI